MLHTVLLVSFLATFPSRSPSPAPHRLGSHPPADSVRPDDEVRLVALRHATEIRQCYETRGLKINPTLSGTLEIELVVLPTGRVDSAAVTASQLVGRGKEEVESCVVETVRNWRYARGPFETESIVYPFELVREVAVNDRRSS